jgi:hypothetical protein
LQTYLEVGSGEPIEKENLVEFRLLYEGPLHTDNSDHARTEKHRIRKVFHRQLRRLWETHPNLRIMARMSGGPEYVRDWVENHGTGGVPAAISEDEIMRWGFKYLSYKWARSGFKFLPLVVPELCLRCSLDILFLRMEERDYVLQGGDLDGRIHVLFDGLRMIRDGQEIPPKHKTPEADEDPFFCLLQDDTLVSDVKINTGRLLLLPNQKDSDQHDVYLQITVKLNPVQRSQYSWVFE